VGLSFAINQIYNSGISNRKILFNNIEYALISAPYLFDNKAGEISQAGLLMKTKF